MFKNNSLLKNHSIIYMMLRAFMMSLFITCLVLYIYHSIVLKEKIKNDSLSHASVLIHSLTTIIENEYSPDSIQRTISALSGLRNINAIYIVDKKSQIIQFASEQKNKGQNISDLSLEGLKTELIANDLEIFDEVESQTIISREIRIDSIFNKNNAFNNVQLVLAIDSRPVIENVYSDFMNVIYSVFTVIFLFSAILYILIYNYLLKPLQYISSVIIKRSSGKKDFINMNTNSEIGRLANKIDEMYRVLEQNEVEIEAQRGRLIQSAKMSSLGEMAAGIAHEVNNPLMIIRGYVRQSKRYIESNDLLNTELNSSLLKIDQMCIRIGKIIQGLRSFSRSGEADQKVKFSCIEMINETLELCRQRIEQNGVQIYFAPDTDYFIFGRSVQISQVLMNLISNSFDAIRDQSHSWIKITLEKTENNFIQIRVVDSGNGIPKEILEKIMQPFFTTKELGKGTGLGLSISKGIIEEHNGLFQYELYESHTSFVITLPTVEAVESKVAV